MFTTPGLAGLLDTGMRLVRKNDLPTADGNHISGAPGLELTWLQGPTTNDELDVGFAQVNAGAQTPIHTHLKGQVIITVSGSGFVETSAGERIETNAGDIVMCPAGESHVHGSAGNAQWSHLTISTGTHEVPQ
jgi:quercetin dioxygenase-like cupin family protein